MDQTDRQDDRQSRSAPMGQRCWCRRRLAGPANHFPFFNFFYGHSKVPEAEGVYLQARGAGMTTPAWYCGRAVMSLEAEEHDV